MPSCCGSCEPTCLLNQPGAKYASSKIELSASGPLALCLPFAHLYDDPGISVDDPLHCQWKPMPFPALPTARTTYAEPIVEPCSSPEFPDHVVLVLAILLKPSERVALLSVLTVSLVFLGKLLKHPQTIYLRWIFHANWVNLTT